MGTRSPVRRVRRNGAPRLVIDFFYRDETGHRRRYRKDASTTSMTAARQEAERLMNLAAKTGTPSPRGEVPTFRSFVEDYYRPLHMPRLRQSTRQRYEALLTRQGILDFFGKRKLTEVASVVPRYAAELVQERHIKPRGHVDLIG